MWTGKTSKLNISSRFDFGQYNLMVQNATRINYPNLGSSNIFMEIKPIKTEKDYYTSLKRIEELWGAKRDTQDGDEFDLLCTLVESYEMKHYPIAPPDPIDAIIFRMEQMGMTKMDMVEYLGSQSRVSEVLNSKRKLSLKMVKSLNKGLKIPAEVLLA